MLSARHKNKWGSTAKAIHTRLKVLHTMHQLYYLGEESTKHCFISRYFRTRIHRIKKADPTGWTATALKGVTTSSPRTFWCHFLQAHLLQLHFPFFLPFCVLLFPFLRFVASF